MEIYHFISVAVPLTLAVFLPKILRSKNKNEKPYRKYLYFACVLFFISWYLPSPLIDGQDTSFTTHFVGGGIFSFLLWEYLRSSLRLRLSLLVDMVCLFVLVSALGVVNELFEFILVQTYISTITLTDTSYDLVANTLGAALSYSLFIIVRLR